MSAWVRRAGHGRRRRPECFIDTLYSVPWKLEKGLFIDNKYEQNVIYFANVSIFQMRLVTCPNHAKTPAYIYKLILPHSSRDRIIHASEIMVWTVFAVPNIPKPYSYIFISSCGQFQFAVVAEVQLFNHRTVSLYALLLCFFYFCSIHINGTIDATIVAHSEVLRHRWKYVIAWPTVDHVPYSRNPEHIRQCRLEKCLEQFFPMDMGNRLHCVGSLTERKYYIRTLLAAWAFSAVIPQYYCREPLAWKREIFVCNALAMRNHWKFAEALQ